MKDNKRKNQRENSRDDKSFRFRRMRKKVCALCKDSDMNLDYKDSENLRRFVTEKGKILPRRVTGTCAKHQRVVTETIKRAREIAILPYSVN